MPRVFCIFANSNASAMKENRLAGHAACLIAYTIFGFNIILCKDLTGGDLISPMSIFTLRSLGAGALFWLLSLFMPREKVETRDYPKIFAASILGFFICQMTFLVALPNVTPMDCSILASLSPIYTMFIAAIALKEPITIKKAGGVLISLVGLIMLILNSVSMKNGTESSSIGGIIIMIFNGLSFSLYLGLFKPLIGKYQVVTFMKWIFLFSALTVLPFSAKELSILDWTSIPKIQLWELGYLIIFATFISYFLIPFGQKRIRPTLVSMYSYAQPIVAIGISISIGMDTLTWQKILAATMVFGGVILVSRSRAARTDNIK